MALGYVAAFAHRHSPWPLGDWLINYEGGFVRRGLPGEILLLAHRLLHLPLIGGVACLEAACVLCMFACLWPLVAAAFRAGSSLWEKALLFSPATLAFLWLDPGLILRKEIALFALLGILIHLLRRTPAVSDAWVSAFLGAACPVLLLSHEGLVCYLPYAVAAVVLGRRSLARALRICAVPAALSVVAVAAAALHPGTQEISSRICASVGGPASGLCAGPIWYVGLSRQVYAAEVTTLLHDRGMLLAFAITGALALLPAVAGLADLWRRPLSRHTRAVLPAAFLLAALASTVLFLQAQDWSRWIYIHVMCLLFLLLFAVEQRDAHGLPEASVAAPQPVWRLSLRVLALVLYAVSWHLPEWILPGAREYEPVGYKGVALRLERHFRIGSDHAGM